ncbi:MAG: hypothetical protein JWQ38_2367 [Flavipsychrobacter sp.]|nr:hypothetical protein [Flavipsychrobacter sp.]
MRGWYFVFFSLGMFMVIGSLFFLSAEILVTCIILSLFTFTYSWPLLPFKGRKRLREYGWLKILVLTGVWTIVTSILPILYSNKHIMDYPIEVALRFIFIFTLCMIFDIRDMQTDAKSNISTLPNKVGIGNSYLLINAALLIFVLLSVVQYVRYPMPVRLAGAVLTAIATRLVVSYLDKHPSGKAYLALADGMMLLYAVLILAPNP